MLRFLYFADASANGTDNVCMPVTHLRQMSANSDATSITFRFEDIRDGIAEQVNCSITVTQNKCREVMGAVSKSIRSSKNPFIVVADDNRKEYLHKDILGTNGSVNIA